MKKLDFYLGGPVHRIALIFIGIFGFALTINSITAIFFENNNIFETIIYTAPLGAFIFLVIPVFIFESRLSEIYIFYYLIFISMISICIKKPGDFSFIFAALVFVYGLHINAFPKKEIIKMFFYIVLFLIIVICFYVSAKIYQSNEAQNMINGIAGFISSILVIGNMFGFGKEYTISDKEKKFLDMICEGEKQSYIAEEMGMKVRGVQEMQYRIIKKTGSKTISGAIKFLVKNGSYS